MRRVDAIVAAVGAVIVLLAAVGAAVRAPATAEFVVTFPTSEVALGDGSVERTAQDVREQFRFTVNESNATTLRVSARVAFVGGPGAMALMTILLTGPDGRTFEAEGETRAGGVGGTQPVAVAELEVPLAPLPANGTLEAASREDAVARAAPASASPAPWLGEWTLDVSARAGPAPLARSTTAWEASLTAWRAEATAAPAPGK